MAKRQRNRKEQLAEVIRESHEQWKRLRENGGNDPFWTDGVNLNLVRNHIIYGRRLCEEELQEGDYPEEYYLPLPEKVPPNYMVKGDEIRRKASELMRNIKENPDYIGLFGKSEKSKKEAEIIKYISGYSQSISEDDLVAMRRFIHWDFSGMMQSIKEELRDITPVAEIEKSLPEGQLSIFDLFNIQRTGEIRR